MSKTASKVEVRLTDSQKYEIRRENCLERFIVGKSIFKRKITQGLYWALIEKDIADQFTRDERWFMGVKFWDAMKTIGHGIKSSRGSRDYKNTTIGFNQ
jgi:hypothetical protein